jgi:hypothetical protein
VSSTEEWSNVASNISGEGEVAGISSYEDIPGHKENLITSLVLELSVQLPWCGSTALQISCGVISSPRYLRVRDVSLDVPIPAFARSLATAGTS